jgi:hypothetical protein
VDAAWLSDEEEEAPWLVSTSLFSACWYRVPDKRQKNNATIPKLEACLSRKKIERRTVKNLLITPTRVYVVANTYIGQE